MVYGGDGSNASKITLQQLKVYGQEVGLDIAVFEQCLTSGTDQAAVQNDVAESACAGVTGAPAFFIVGRLASGTERIELLCM